MSEMCKGKRTWPTLLDAIGAAAWLCRLGPQRAYHCPHCQQWHLTSKRAFR